MLNSEKNQESLELEEIIKNAKNLNRTIKKKSLSTKKKKITYRKNFSNHEKFLICENNKLENSLKNLNYKLMDLKSENNNFRKNNFNLEYDLKNCKNINKEFENRLKSYSNKFEKRKLSFLEKKNMKFNFLFLLKNFEDDLENKILSQANNLSEDDFKIIFSDFEKIKIFLKNQNLDNYNVLDLKNYFDSILEKLKNFSTNNSFYKISNQINILKKEIISLLNLEEKKTFYNRDIKQNDFIYNIMKILKIEYNENKNKSREENNSLNLERIYNYFKKNYKNLINKKKKLNEKEDIFNLKRYLKTLENLNLEKERNIKNLLESQKNLKFEKQELIKELKNVKKNFENKDEDLKLKNKDISVLNKKIIILSQRLNNIEKDSKEKDQNIKMILLINKDLKEITENLKNQLILKDKDLEGNLEKIKNLENKNENLILEIDKKKLDIDDLNKQIEELKDENLKLKIKNSKNETLLNLSQNKKIEIKSKKELVKNFKMNNNKNNSKKNVEYENSEKKQKSLKNISLENKQKIFYSEIFENGKI